MKSLRCLAKYWAERLKRCRNDDEIRRLVLRIPLKTEQPETWRSLMADLGNPWFLRKAAALQYCVRYTKGARWVFTCNLVQNSLGGSRITEKHLHIGAPSPLKCSMLHNAHFILDLTEDTDAISSVEFAVGPKETIARSAWEGQGISPDQLYIKDVIGRQPIDQKNSIIWYAWGLLRPKYQIVH